MVRNSKSTGTDAASWRPLGRSQVRVQSFGLGLAPIGVADGPAGDRAAAETIERAWSLGIRTFDVAPFYSAGRAERRAGAALRNYPRDEFVISTKVGRLPGDGFDFSEKGIRAQLERSQERLALDRVDYIHVHDPDAHEAEALAEGIPAALALREAGAVGAVGVGMNQSGMLTRLVAATDVDCVLVAGRNTLLDQSAQDDLLPLCLQRGVGVVLGGAFNSGILADPQDGATYDYRPATPEILARARALQTIALRHQAPLAAAALQFGFGHPAVTTVLVGAATADAVAEDAALVVRPLPPRLWDDLRAVVDPDHRYRWPELTARRRADDGAASRGVQA